MKIKKRNESLQEFNPAKILNRLKTQSKGLKVDFTQIAIEVQQSLYDGITTQQIDNESARIASSYNTDHPDYALLAGKIYVSRLQKELLSKTFLERCSDFLHPDVVTKINKWGINPNYTKDYSFDYFGIFAVLNIYSIKDSNLNPIELPSEIWFRVSVYLSESVEEFHETYEQLTNKLFSDASPILINSGRKTGALISCSLNSLNDDSTEGIHHTLGEVAKMSRDSAGIGLWSGNLRSMRTLYANRGKAGGIIKFAKILQEWIKFFKQNENKKGAIAIYTDMWHMDLYEFLELKAKNGKDETTAKDIFTALSVPDLFYKRLIDNDKWSLFCPHQVKVKFGFNLYDFIGEEFELKYKEVEESDIDRIEYPASEVMVKCAKHMIERGTPYMFNRDNANRNYNLSHLGVLKGLNLCIEFMGYHDSETSAQCDLGSIPVLNHVKNGKVDYDSIGKSVELLTKHLNRVIDKNPWSCESAKKGGLEQRNIGIGIAGLADLAAILDLPFTSEKFKKINRNIQEVMYFHALKASNEYYINKEYEGFVPFYENIVNKSPLVQKGQLTFDLETTETFIDKNKWGDLVTKIKETGVANSLFLCNMPTASTSILLGCNEAFEPFQDLVFNRVTISGEFTVVNKYLINDLIKYGIWNEKTKLQILQNESIQNINFGLEPEIEKHIKQKYLTVWELKQKDLIDMAVDRQLFVDQSQSMNLYWNEGDVSKITNALIYGWKNGLKTGVYYTKVKSKTKTDKNLAFKTIKEVDKPKDSLYECFNCSA